MDHFKGITFSAESVEAIICGRKTQTRRAMHIQPRPQDVTFFQLNTAYAATLTEENLPMVQRPRFRQFELILDRPRFAVGDLLYVRETHRFDSFGRVQFRTPNRRGPWRSPRFMRRDDARVWVRVVDRWAEKLHDITAADAVAEGIVLPDVTDRLWNQDAGEAARAVECFAEHWDRINRARGFAWASNPWVWSYQLAQEKQSDGPIEDRVPRDADQRSGGSDEERTSLLPPAKFVLPESQPDGL